MKRNLKTRLLSAVMILSYLLTGCGVSKKKVDLGIGAYSYIYYQNDGFKGSIPSKYMENIKIVTFEQDGVTTKRLMAVQVTTFAGFKKEYDKKIEYVDFESGATLIKYGINIDDGNNEITECLLGENIKILEEELILPKLYNAGIYQDAYEADEVLEFYKGLPDYTFSSQDDGFVGSISAKNMEQVKIVAFEQDGVVSKRLMITDEVESNNPAYDCKIQYRDFENGTPLIEYDVCFTLHPKRNYYLGEDINILEEEPILQILHDAGINKETYEACEVLAFFKGMTDSTLSSQDDEAIKYSNSTDIVAIKYMANGEEVSNLPDDVIFADSEIPTISCKMPTRKGYTFVGWSTDPNALEADDEYSAGKQYFGPNLVLYAVWEEHEISPELPDTSVDLEDDRQFIITPRIGQ